MEFFEAKSVDTFIANRSRQVPLSTFNFLEHSIWDSVLASITNSELTKDLTDKVYVLIKPSAGIDAVYYIIFVFSMLLKNSTL